MLLSMMEPLIFYWNRLIRRKKKRYLEVFDFQLMKLNHLNIFYVVISRLFMTSLSVGQSTFVRNGIISKVCKVRTIVLKKQITKTYVKQQRPKYIMPIQASNKESPSSKQLLFFKSFIHDNNLRFKSFIMKS